MTSKLVLDRQKAGRSIIEASATNASAIDAGFAQNAPPAGRGHAHPPSAGALLEFMANALEARTQALVAADEALTRELADDAEPRDRRDAKANALHGELTEIRSTVSGVTTPTKVRELGFVGETPVDPTALVNLARLVSKNAATVTFTPHRQGVHVDLHRLVNALADLANQVDTATRDVAREERERHAALVARDNALSAWNHAYQGLAGTLEGMLTFAGLDALADRVRPLLRRNGATATPAEGETPPPAT